MSRPIRSNPWTIVALLFVVALLNYFDRQSLSVVAPRMQAELHLSDTGYGHIVSLFLLASAFADRFDRRDSLLLCYLGLTIATLACGLADSFHWLLIARILAGFFGGGMSAVALAIVGDVIPAQRRGHAMGIVMLAFSLAAIAGVPLGLFIANHYHWQTPFLFLVVLCSLVFVLSWFVVPPVRSHLQQTQVAMWQSYKELLSVPNHWWGFITSSLVLFGGFMVIPYIAPALDANTELGNEDLPYI